MLSLSLTSRWVSLLYALILATTFAVSAPSSLDLTHEQLGIDLFSRQEKSDSGAGGKKYTLEELWAEVEKGSPVKYAAEQEVRKGPFTHEDIYVPKDPYSQPFLTPDYKSIKDTKVGHLKFPKGFKYGVASAAAQVEGAVKTDGRGPSIWDYVAHQYPSSIYDQSTPDIADNHYYLYEYDIARIKKMGVSTYSFSISWSRVLPLGRGEVNQKGLDFYDRFIDAIIDAGIEPVATLFHWDVPLALEYEYGSYRSERIVDDFVAYAEIAFKRWGHKVKSWVTHNEPGVFCPRYDSTLPLNATNPTQYDGHESRFRCTYHLLKAHGEAVSLYRSLKESGQVAKDGEIGIKLDNSYPLPYDSASPADVENAARAEAFNVGIWAEPIFGSGDWPKIIKEAVPSDLLISFTAKDKELIKGSADFFALDGYDIRITKSLPSPQYDSCKQNTSDPNWPICADGSKLAYSQSLKGGWTLGQQADPLAPWLYNSAGAIRWYGKKLKEMYPSKKYYLTEFGFAEPYESDKTEIHQIREDTARSQYMVDYLSEILLSIHEDNVPWAGIFAWSLLDNFEWYIGLRLRFGMQYVNFTDPSLPRTFKRSFIELRDFMNDHLEG
ncbi:glycoside hydrolase [Violaceomyces palustris]|uniref:Glycoside hydrolase n=1 Tax=Violaceomyces palustris TaxID=1673888 RepID=A0ACD0NRX2_9BASI|nr:glycoside hydrolase [Violaceomyces palustris]